MISRVLAAGLLAGLLAGLAIAILQAFTTTPLILEAEGFEGGHVHDHSHEHGQIAPTAPARLSNAVFEPSDHAALIPVHSEEGGGMWMPADGWERTIFTGIATIGTAIGLALVLLAGMLFVGDRITERSAVAWAGAGFVATGLAPAMGLRPNCPVCRRRIWSAASPGGSPPRCARLGGSG
ncbi:putative cobalt transporter subunit (CbtA) [Methyloligella halotolerans]|uniref:Putative cobalt transporter subunit (CbtA) n=1 Tax=Methyloligella halotolerans TaxID=1177755 RepID=A0A1E2S1P9_9HYPH|nr:CbtA family protein [Methyloligella halotolerans]ODA68268.1 putative cobalt transporter subunit (CbtA) [Methyloligella halotolerans]